MKLSQKSLAYLLIAMSILATLTLLYYVPPIPQKQDYHAFAAQTKIWGIPNFWNVVSNMGFIIVGVFGLISLGRPNPKNLIVATVFLGILFTGIGSAYYHWNPNNHTLVPDRLPMTMVFSSFFCLILAHYFEQAQVKKVWFVLLPLSMASVGYWHYTESIGEGDLRPYLLVQFLPIILLLIMLLFGSTQKPLPLKPIWLIFISYLLAKLCESFDHPLADMLPEIGGHPLKHLLASISTYFMLAIAFQKVKN